MRAPRSGPGAVLLTLAALAGLADPTAGEPLRCPDDLLRVEAEDAALAARLCTLAPATRDRLGACGLTQSRALSVEVVEDLRHPLGNCLACLDGDRIRIADPATRHVALDPGDPYARLPTDALLDALLTHELAHALTTQAAGARAVDIVDQEYIAAAMELELMHPAARDIVLGAAGVDRPPSAALIDIWFYGFAPRDFAINAWRHFRAEEDGCALLRQLVAGDRTFSRPLRPDMR